LRRFLPHDCRCKVQLAACPEHGPHPCDCPLAPLPCEHLVEAMRRPWPLPHDAVAFLLWLGKPRDYFPPPLPEESSENVNPRAHVAVMAGRRKRKRHIRHPLDWLRLGMQEVDERLTRRLTRLRNGADGIGPLLLEGSEEGK